MPSQIIVIDANIAVQTVLPVSADENALNLMTRWYTEQKQIAAPDLWLSEAASVIRRFVYLKLISSEQGKTAVDDLFSLGIETVPLNQEICQNAFDRAERLRHSKIYDSIYISVAEYLNAEFWTGDRRLFNGAKQAGFVQIHWIGEL